MTNMTPRQIRTVCDATMIAVTFLLVGCWMLDFGISDPMMSGTWMATKVMGAVAIVLCFAVSAGGALTVVDTMRGEAAILRWRRENGKLTMLAV